MNKVPCELNKARTLAQLQSRSYEETGVHIQFRKFPTKKEAGYYEVIGFLVGNGNERGAFL
ncbi:hypothetical protein AXG94_24150 [Pseudomonas corrugata]|nr:hypothetical protein AXG94_24150 [Pseudomonas corrugata]